MYIVIELQTNTDGSVSNFVWAFNTLPEAEAKYHSVLSFAATSALPVHGAVILRNDGLQMAAQAYKREEENANE